MTNAAPQRAAFFFLFLYGSSAVAKRPGQPGSVLDASRIWQ